jgi:hypothetical protein
MKQRPRTTPHWCTLVAGALCLSTLTATSCSPTAPDPGEQNAALLADTALETVSGLPIVELQVGEIEEPLTFVVDTGFDVSILDAATAERHGLGVGTVRREAQPGGDVEMATLPPTTLRIGPLEIDAVEVTTVPLGGLAAVLGRSFHGILGHDVLGRFVVDLDYPAGRIRFSDPRSWQPPADAEAVEIEIRNGEPLANGILITANGLEVPGRFKLDTGSLDVAGLNLNFVRDHGVVGPDDRELRSGGVAVGGGTEGRLFRAGALVLGPRRLERPLIGYTVDSAGFENRDNAGTIGVGLLALSRLVLDYPHGRVLFVGPASEPMPEDRSGMLVVSPGPAFDELYVVIVMEDSPAAEAGLVAGDRIVSLDGREGLSLTEARALQRQDGPLEVVYLRDGDRRHARLQRRPLIAME